MYTKEPMESVPWEGLRKDFGCILGYGVMREDIGQTNEQQEAVDTFAWAFNNGDSLARRVPKKGSSCTYVSTLATMMPLASILRVPFWDQHGIL